MTSLRAHLNIGRGGPIRHAAREGDARTYLMFSHTCKAQESDVELLFKFLNPPSATTSQPDPLRLTLMDEVLTDENDKRTVEYRRVCRRSGLDVLLASN